MTIGEKIIEARKALNLTQAQLSEAIGEHVTTISVLERGITTPRAGTVGRIEGKIGQLLARGGDTCARPSDD